MKDARKGKLFSKVKSNTRTKKDIDNVGERIDHIMKLYEKKGLDAAIDYIVFNPRF